MLFLLLYLFPVSLHLYFFIPLSRISIYTVNGIGILRIFCYLNISKKIKSVNIFSAQQTWKLRLNVSSLLVSTLSPCFWSSEDNTSPTFLLLKLRMFTLIMSFPQSSQRGAHNFHSHSSLTRFRWLSNMLIGAKKTFYSSQTAY